MTSSKEFSTLMYTGDVWDRSNTYTCPKCGSSDVVYDCTKVLASMPPQYRCKCKTCGEEFFSGQCRSNYTNKDSLDDMWKHDQSILNTPKIEDPLPGQQWSDPFRLTPPSHNNYGWICPKCGRALAPHLDSCKWCSEINSTITLNTTNTEDFDNLKKIVEGGNTITISCEKSDEINQVCNRDCESCQLALNMKTELLLKSDSIFDAVYDYREFIKNCKGENIK